MRSWKRRRKHMLMSESPRRAEGGEGMSDDYIHPLSINGQLMKKDARIAELEAQNAEISTRCQALFSLLPDEIRIGDIQRAVAALKGEEG